MNAMARKKSARRDPIARKRLWEETTWNARPRARGGWGLVVVASGERVNTPQRRAPDGIRKPSPVSLNDNIYGGVFRGRL